MNKRYPIPIGCTPRRHAELGIHAVVNARGGRQHLNCLTQEDIELQRDSQRIALRKSARVRFYQFNSKFCRRHRGRLAHYLSEADE